MKIAVAAGLSAVLTSAATIIGLQWPTEQRLGWLELEGQPVALDGTRVQDWHHVNEILANCVAAKVDVQAFLNERPRTVGDHEQVFALDYLPDNDPHRVHRATVRQSLPLWMFWAATMHPMAYARYAVVAVAPLSR